MDNIQRGRVTATAVNILGSLPGNARQPLLVVNNDSTGHRQCSAVVDIYLFSEFGNRSFASGNDMQYVPGTWYQYLVCFFAVRYTRGRGGPGTQHPAPSTGDTSTNRKYSHSSSVLTAAVRTSNVPHSGTRRSIRATGLQSLIPTTLCLHLHFIFMILLLLLILIVLLYIPGTR